MDPFILKANRALCESKSPLPVREVLVSRVPAAMAGDCAVEKAFGGNLHAAKISQADAPNRNNRVYTRKSWADNIDRIQPLLAQGRIIGAVDHLSMVASGNLSESPILWRKVWMDGDGGVYGQYEVVANHSKGRDLLAQKDAGMSIGFSTYGFSLSHAPTEEECAKYGINAEDYVVMNDSGEGAYQLAKVDAVDDPSCPDAWDILPKNASHSSAAFHPLATAEACSNGLHWIEMGTCGHVRSQCKCPDDKKHYLYSEHPCEKCVGQTDKPSGLTVEQFKSNWKEAKNVRPAVAEGRPPLAQKFAQYVKGKDAFEPVGPIELAPTLTQDAYKIVPTWDGIRFVRMLPKTDELYHFAGSVVETVLKEIDTFWDLKKDYAELGVLHNRGLILYGAPGHGKTSAVNQAVELVIGRGDVVFYGKHIDTLGEGLRAFRDVEPDRKVVVVLEDADEYVGYQERQFLNLLDGEESIEGILYVATTNYLERFPPRLIRPGRFDKKVLVGPPTKEGRLAYLSKKLAKVETPEEIDRLADATDGLSFGHLRELVTAVYALKEPKDEVLARLKGVKSARKDSAQQPFATSETHRDNLSRLSGLENETSATGIEPMKTLAELKDKAPEAFAAHEAAVKAVADKAIADKAAADKATADTKALFDSVLKHLNATIVGVKDVAGVELPQREVLPAETADRIKALEAEVKASKEAAAKLEAEKAAVQKKLDDSAAEKAEADRLAKVEAKGRTLLKDNVFATRIGTKLADAAKADKSFDEAKVEAFVKAQTEDYEAAVKDTTRIPAPGLELGEDEVAEMQDAEIEESDGDEIEVPAALLNYGKKK